MQNKFKSDFTCYMYISINFLIETIYEPYYKVFTTNVIVGFQSLPLVLNREAPYY